MKLKLFSAEDLAQTVPMTDAVEAMKKAFAAFSDGSATVPPRMTIRQGENATLLMGAAMKGGGLAAKIVSVFPGNAAAGRPVVNGLVIILDPETGVPKALCDGRFLTAWRTGAASGAATDLLSRSDAREAGIIGLGAQARTQLLAIVAVRNLSTVYLYSRDPVTVRRFIDEMQPQVQPRLQAVGSAGDVVSRAEILCLATNSSDPVFDGRQIKKGTHINGIGSFTLQMRECDGETVRRSKIFVDSKKAALAEAGDLVQAMTEGGPLPDQWTELGQVVAGSAPGRTGEGEITFFKSVGLAVQDVVLASRLANLAAGSGAGKDVEF